MIQSPVLLYFIFCVVGRTCVFLVQKFPLNRLPVAGRLFREGGFLHDLVTCDLCLGVWGFALLSFLFRFNLLSDFFYVPVLSEFITGGVTSVLVFLVVRGYQAVFSVIEVK